MRSLQGVVGVGHDLVVLHAVQDPLLGDAVLAAAAALRALPHQDARGPRARAQVPAPRHDQLSEVRRRGPALPADVYAANI